MTLRIALARSPQDELLSVGKPVSRRLRLTELLCRLVRVFARRDRECRCPSVGWR
jgi:hypothetical protein